MHDGFARQHFKARKHRFGVFTGVGYETRVTREQAS